jgi:uncharacterized protein DUF4252
MRTVPLLVAAVAALPFAVGPAAAESPASSHPGYVDGATFRTLVDEDKEIVEINIEGPMLQALCNKKDDDPETRELFCQLKAIHAVIGSVRGPAASALALVQQTDQKLVALGWQRITRIKDEDSWVSVLTHVSGDKIDGLVALIFDSNDKEIVFANLAGPVDLTRLGEIGDRLNVPGLDHLPGVD